MRTGFWKVDQLGRREGMVLPAVVILSVFLVALGVGLLDLTFNVSRLERERTETVHCSYLAYSGLQATIAEITSGVDSTGFGLGAMGVIDGVPYSDSQGRKLGEFRSVLRPIGNDYEALVVAAIPDFDNPRVMRSVRGRVASSIPYLAPQRAAFAVVGALKKPELLLQGDV